MMSRLGVWLMRRMAVLPLPVLRALGWLLGQLLYVLAAPRRRIALRNLELCYPQASAAQRLQPLGHAGVHAGELAVDAQIVLLINRPCTDIQCFYFRSCQRPPLLG